MADYDPITGDPLLHLGPDDDVVYDHGRDEWVPAKPPVDPIHLTAPTDVDEHAPRVTGGPHTFAWECNCGRYSSQTWRSDFEAAYAAGVHVRNPDGPT